MSIREKKVVCFFALLFFFFIFTSSAYAFETGLDNTAKTAGYETTGIDIQTYIGYGIQAVLGVAGAILFGLLVYGGVLWMISDGEQTKIKKALDVIKYAITGIIIILGAYTVTKFITEQIAKKTLQGG